MLRPGIVVLAISASALAATATSAAEPHWGGAVGEVGVNGAVRALCVFNDGSGPALYAGGDFTMAGGAPASHIARWDGQSWTPLGLGVDGAVYALHVFDDGRGAALYIGGDFAHAGGAPASRLARWDGHGFEEVGGGVSGVINPSEFAPPVGAFCTWDEDGPGPLAPALIVGGSFTMVGQTPAQALARWRGGAWEQVGGGIQSIVNALRVHDDGSGPALFVGGTVLRLGGQNGQPSGYIGRWNGQQWSTMLDGLDAQPRAFATFPGGADQRLFTCGTFSRAAHGPNMHFVGAWTGQSWQPLGAGFVLLGKALAVFDARDGAGPNVYGGGHFDMHRWNGAMWSAIPGPTGTPWYVYSLCVFDDGLGAGPALYAGGLFGGVGVNIASLRGAPPCAGDANGDGVVNFADLNIVLGSFGQSAPGAPGTLPGDVNGDGTVNFADLNIVLGAFGSVC